MILQQSMNTQPQQEQLKLLTIMVNTCVMFRKKTRDPDFAIFAATLEKELRGKSCVEIVPADPEAKRAVA